MPPPGRTRPPLAARIPPWPHASPPPGRTHAPLWPWQVPRVELVVGDVEETIPAFIEVNPQLLIALVYVDLRRGSLFGRFARDLGLWPGSSQTEPG